jgi:hypothetical protein
VSKCITNNFSPQPYYSGVPTTNANGFNQLNVYRTITIGRSNAVDNWNDIYYNAVAGNGFTVFGMTSTSWSVNASPSPPLPPSDTDSSGTSYASSIWIVEDFNNDGLDDILGELTLFLFPFSFSFLFTYIS